MTKARPRPACPSARSGGHITAAQQGVPHFRLISVLFLSARLLRHSLSQALPPPSNPPPPCPPFLPPPEPLSACVPNPPLSQGDSYDVREGSGAGDVRNLGKPVELAGRYFAEGADEVTFLNITVRKRISASAHSNFRGVARASCGEPLRLRIRPKLAQSPNQYSLHGRPTPPCASSGLPGHASEGRPYA